MNNIGRSTTIMKSIIANFIPICALLSFSACNDRNNPTRLTKYEGKQSAEAISDCAKCFEEQGDTAANTEQDSVARTVGVGQTKGANEPLDTFVM